ncbi:uncharacterized protein LOC125268851 [Megalobrama amblycephala]|uniref:uncharacterized protein LOC125268851 n=1 Tax=Megalobrama amblycephala TaxID=75352 RepID=UPI00201411EA|nr:uncharacterized protein LOC125268851 [Megalobrama amblycephala]XP_048047389.1 uncharacterized protein LOC125268851 [Megalobrama amblycephala]
MANVILCIFLSVALLISEKLVVVLAHQGDTQLGSSVTLPCQDSKHRDISADLLDIQWFTGEHLVVRFQRGRITQGSRYINRTYLSAEGLRNGDFSLSIPRTEFSDSGRYRYVLTQEGQEVALGEVDLESPDLKVLCLLSQDRGSFYLVSAMVIGQAQRLHLCNGRDGLRWCFSGNLDLCMWIQCLRAECQFQRTESSMATCLLFSMTLSLEDQGYYVCFFKKNDDIRPSTIINLTVTEQMSRVNITSGSQFQLPLPNESPVMLSFLPDGENYTVPVCEVEKRQLTCARHYCNRTLLQNNSLILRNITLADSGTFIVSEKGTSRTRNVVNVHLCRVGPGPGKVTFDGPLSPLAAAALGGSLLFLVVTSAYSGYVCHKQRQINRIPEHGTEKNREKGAEKESEMQPLQFIEVITQGSVSSKKSAVI